jgi:CHAD domain-containing protein
MREQIERELKLNPRGDFHLSELGEVSALPDRSFVSTYYDTQDLRLARHGVTFRHRSEDGTGLWQLKVPRGAARIELEEPGPPARPPAALLALLVAHLRGVDLVRVARLRTRRKSVRAAGAEIVDDSVAVMDGQRITGRFRELEVELLDGDEQTLQRLEKALRKAGAESGVFVPKIYRVLDLAYPSEHAEMAADATPGEAVGVALVEQYRRLLAHDPGTRLGSDSEDLHQMRVATRRARAFLRAARPLLGPDWADELRAELGWLGSALGPARDLDVLLEHVREEVAALGSDAERVRGLVNTLERERDQAHAAAIAALSEKRYFALLDRLEGAGSAPLASDVTTTLEELWWHEFRRTRKTFSKLGPKASDDELHAGRIRVKRARYAAELAAHALGRGGERFVAAARKLQDILGDHQDARVAEDRISSWAQQRGAAGPAVEALVGRERSRRKQAREDWPPAWKKLERRGGQSKP